MYPAVKRCVFNFTIKRCVVVVGIQQLEQYLDSEMNECLLFHGTKQQNVIAIVDGSADFRLTTASYFGQGTYFAECSTKADQYVGK